MTSATCRAYAISVITVNRAARPTVAMPKRRSRNRHTWTIAEVEYIRDNYATMSAAAIAKHIGCAKSGVYGVAHRLGVYKDKQWIADTARELAQRPNHGGIATRFQPGHRPHSKGRRQAEYMTPEAIAKSAATRFKPGNKPKNYRPVGSERISRDGYIEVKVKEGLFGWALKHRIIWEEARGKVPKGYCLMFKDGNKLNCELDNLELVTMAERLDRVRISRYPEELRDLIRVKARLRREITKQRKKNGNKV